MEQRGDRIYYRFGSERGIWRELALESTGGILISDLKILIAEQTNLNRDFARQTNLVVSQYDENDPDAVEVLEDNVVVHRGSRLVINRVAWVASKPIIHQAKRKIEGIVTSERRQLRMLPIGMVCNLCLGPLNVPLLVKCSFNCGSTGCKACIEAKIQTELQVPPDDAENQLMTLEEPKNCPFCGGMISALLKNKSVETFLSGINLENYALPTSLEELQTANHLEAPDYFLYNVPDDVVSVILERSLLPVYSGSLLHSKLSAQETTDTEKESLVFLITHIGGGTSINLLGVLQLLYTVYSGVDDFLTRCGCIAAVKFEWIKRVKVPTILPARKQPFFAFLGARKCEPIAMNSTSDNGTPEVVWRAFFGANAIEVGLVKPAFDSLVENFIGKITKKPVMENKTWLDVCFPRGPPPLYIDVNGNVLSKEMITDEALVDLQNPYLGYLGILPFLSNSQFVQLRRMQRKVKQQFLQDTSRAVVNCLAKDVGEPILESLYQHIWKAPTFNLN